MPAIVLVSYQKGKPEFTDNTIHSEILCGFQVFGTIVEPDL